MKFEWVVLSESGVSHAFPDDGTPVTKVRSLCGLRFPRQLVLPYNLKPPERTHCVRCGWGVEKRASKEKAA
jgi:hypothetical protein